MKMETYDREYILGIDIGGTYLRTGMMDINGVLDNFKVEPSSILDKNNEQVKNLESYIGDYINHYGRGKLLAISIGFPSAVSRDKKVVYQSPNITGFNHVNVGDILGNAFHVPVFVENDVSNLLVYEIIERNLENCGTVIGIYFGTGLGNAIYINDGILEGKHGIAGELGHIPVPGKSDICGCGNSGCMEVYASGKRLEELQAKYFPGTNIKDMFKYHRDDPILQEFVETLSIPIAVEMNIFDPDYIVVGGGVVNMEGFPKKELQSYVYKHARKPYPGDDFKLFYAAGSKESGVRGAAYNACRRLGIINTKTNP